MEVPGFEPGTYRTPVRLYKCEAIALPLSYTPDISEISSNIFDFNNIVNVSHTEHVFVAVLFI